MVQLIVGTKGKGKTVALLDKVNKDAKTAEGSIVYLDKCDQHIHGLSNKVRLVNVSDYKLQNADQFVGFIKGITSQNYDIQEIYVDGFLKVAHVSEGELEDTIKQLEAVCEQAHLDIILSVSVDGNSLSQPLKEKVIASL